MKRTPLNSSSKKGDLIIKCEDLCKQILIILQGARCRFCGSIYDLTLFHILPKGKYPEVRLLFLNLLIACMDCHRIWENHLSGCDDIEYQIIEILGMEDYKSHILSQAEVLPKVSMFHIEDAYNRLKQMLKLLKSKGAASCDRSGVRQ